MKLISLMRSDNLHYVKLFHVMVKQYQIKNPVGLACTSEYSDFKVFITPHGATHNGFLFGRSGTNGGPETQNFGS